MGFCADSRESQTGVAHWPMAFIQNAAKRNVFESALIAGGMGFRSESDVEGGDRPWGHAEIFSRHGWGNQTAIKTIIAGRERGGTGAWAEFGI